MVASHLRRPLSRLRALGSTVLLHGKKHAGVGVVCAVAYFDPGNCGVWRVQDGGLTIVSGVGLRNFGEQQAVSPFVRTSRPARYGRVPGAFPVSRVSVPFAVLPEKSCAFLSFLDTQTGSAFYADAVVRKLALHAQELKARRARCRRSPSPAFGPPTIELLKDPLLIAQIKALEPFSTEADALVTNFSAVHSKLNTLEVLIDFAARMMADSPISAAFEDLQQRLQAAKQQAQAKSALASHREKRKFVNMAGLNKQYGKSIHDILASQQEDSVGSPHNPRILWRYRHPETSVPVRHRQVLADARSRIAEDAIINAENGYETVGAESVIVLACDEAGNHMVDADGEYIIELVALQGVLTQSELASPLYAWLSG
ncbi:hypothetical protein B0H14DRAFT_3525559 [Mycena olivaceomarginata]|nr:hypothetical protein B0H14DRAFT_3525559 [Mycena olivaceomarginata]